MSEISISHQEQTKEGQAPTAELVDLRDPTVLSKLRQFGNGIIRRAVDRRMQEAENGEQITAGHDSRLRPKGDSQEHQD